MRVQAIFNRDGGTFRTIDPTTHDLTTWDSASGKTSDVIYLNGDYDITSGQASIHPADGRLKDRSE